MRIVAASDIHGDSNALTAIGGLARSEEADIILLAGDICSNIRYRHFIDLLPELADHGKCPVVFTPGNHDFWKPDEWRPEIRCPDRVIRDKHDVVCLIDESVEFQGYKIYGTPWTPEYGQWNWMRPISDLKFDIPQGTKILLAHCPPFGFGDHGPGNKRIGSEAMTEAIQKRPELLVAIYGHAHESAGQQFRQGRTVLCNVACRNVAHHFEFGGILSIEIERGDRVK